MKKKCSCLKKVSKHLKGDIHDFKEEIKEDKELMRKLKNGKDRKKSVSKARKRK